MVICCFYENDETEKRCEIVKLMVHCKNESCKNIRSMTEKSHADVTIKGKDQTTKYRSTRDSDYLLHAHSNTTEIKDGLSKHVIEQEEKKRTFRTHAARSKSAERIWRPPRHRTAHQIIIY